MLAVYLDYICLTISLATGNILYYRSQRSIIYIMKWSIGVCFNRCPHNVQRASIIMRLWVLDPYLPRCSGAHLYFDNINQKYFMMKILCLEHERSVYKFEQSASLRVSYAT